MGRRWPVRSSVLHQEPGRGLHRKACKNRLPPCSYTRYPGLVGPSAFHLRANMTTTESTDRQRFLEDYRRIRHAEGRGSNANAYYRALPFEDLSKRSTAMWRMRAKTYRYFEKHILTPLERRMARPLDILDLGSGNCWLSYRLSLKKHRPVALDIFHDELDGLRAARRYPIPFPVVEAEFDKLPFAPGSADLAIF